MNQSASNGMVMTVLGPIPANELGVTLVHEHMAFGFPGWSADETVAPYDREAIQAKCLTILNDIKAVGVTSVIDATPCDVGGRDPLMLKQLSEKSGVHIIASTGLYYERDGGAAYYKWLQFTKRDIAQDIYELFTQEITNGIGKTGVRPGVIKISTDDPAITDYEQLVAGAAVRAAKETGVPIITHCQGSTVGPAQQELFLRLGANPKRIMIGHQNNSLDINYHLSQLKQPGFFISFDRTGSINGPAAEDCIIELIKQGHADRLTLSHDSIGVWLGRPIDLGPAAADWYPTYIHNKLIPKMTAAGVTDKQIRTMLVDNPRRLFTGE
jgi:phosphotriesterase-related protein